MAQAINRGLSVMAENRQQTLEELYRELYMSRQDFRATKRSRIYQGINKFLIRLIVGIVLSLIIFSIVWIKRNEISDAVSQVAEKFVTKEDEDLRASRNLEEDKEEKEQEEEDDESDREEKERDAAKDTEDPAETEHDEVMQDTQRQTRIEPEDAEADESGQPQDAGSQKYQMMRSGAESASALDDSVIKVKNGQLNNIASGYTVGEILDLYSDTEGQWYIYGDTATSKQYVYYEGRKGDSSFVLEFEVYENNTFKLTGAMQDDQSVERYSDFFQSILDSLGF